MAKKPALAKRSKQAKTPSKPPAPTPPPDLTVSVAANKVQGLVAILVNPPSPQIVFSKQGALEFAANVTRMAESL